MTGEKLKSLGELFASFDLIFFHPFPLSLEKKIATTKRKRERPKQKRSQIESIVDFRNRWKGS